MKNNLLITIALLMLIFSCSQDNENTHISVPDFEIIRENYYDFRINLRYNISK